MSAMKTKAVCISVDKDAFDTLSHLEYISILGYFDLLDRKHQTLRYLGTDQQWKEFSLRHPDIGVIMLVDPPEIKSKLVAHYGEQHLLTVIAPDAYVAHSAVLQDGAIVQRGVKIMPDVKIGKAVKFNINAVAHHDCVVGDFCTLAPGCILLGNVEIGSGSYIGAGSIVLPRIRIGKNVMVGAGSVVTKDIADNLTVMGVPARASSILASDS
jgi:sugar O-acyltransferase (sialic acid O-acetyltransferase NeuD family)